MKTLKVYYQVLNQMEDEQIEYISHRTSGICSKKTMLSKIRQKLGREFDAVEVIQITRISDLLRQQGLWNNPNLSARHLDAIANIVECHASYSVPIRYTVSLISQLLDIDITDICDKAGVHRNYLNNTLKGIHTPTDKVVNVVSSMLGFNPWEFAEWKEIEILNTEIISIKQAEAIINH